MSIKGCRLLWLKLQIEDRRFLKIPVPISLVVFYELLDCFLDVLNVGCFFAPKVTNTNSTSKFTIYSVKELVVLVMKLLDSFAQNESYDLVDIKTDNVNILIRIR
jgi:hypothetical protein